MAYGPDRIFEVYAFSSFLTALMFWLILKWETQADEPSSDRWIILIDSLLQQRDTRRVLEVCRKWTKFSQVSSHTLIRAHDWTFSELNNLEKDYHVAQYF